MSARSRRMLLATSVLDPRARHYGRHHGTDGKFDWPTNSIDQSHQRGQPGSASRSEAAANVDASDFTVSGTTATVTAVSQVNSSTYDVTISGGNLAGLNGTVTLGFAVGQNVIDTAGNSLANTTPTGTNNNSYVLDNTAPSVSWSYSTSAKAITVTTDATNIANVTAADNTHPGDLTAAAVHVSGGILDDLVVAKQH